jgi:hypothetical protein
MIDKQTLKKHNLKAVPFSCIGEGETFFTDFTITLFEALCLRNGLEHYKRKLVGRKVFYTNPPYSVGDAEVDYDYENKTVYVPVWRVCGEVAK